MSLIEAVANTVIGCGVAVITQVLIFPVFGLHTTLSHNLVLGAIFTLASVARSFALRRLFEAIEATGASSVGEARHYPQFLAFMIGVAAIPFRTYDFPD